MDYIEITRDDIELLLRVGKGWIRQTSGNEWLYDFHLSKIPVIIKVLSTVPIDPTKRRNSGSSKFRVWAVVKSCMSKDKYKVTGGLLRASRLPIKVNWKHQLECLICATIYTAKTKYEYRRKTCVPLPKKKD